MKEIRVSAAVIHSQGKIFSTQRGYGDFEGMWEFPGGKREPGETGEQAIVREIKEELAANEPSVIISRRPCALLKYVKHPGPIEAKPEKCVGCKACMKLGCPAISVMGGKVQIDNTLCTGCGLCRQLCCKGALGE